MNHNDYSSALLAQIRNSVRDVNTIAAAETFEFLKAAFRSVPSRPSAV